MTFCIAIKLTWSKWNFSGPITRIQLLAGQLIKNLLYLPSQLLQYPTRPAENTKAAPAAGTLRQSVQGSVQRRPAKMQHVHGKHNGIRPSTCIGNKLDNHRISSLLLRRQSGPKNKFLPPSVGRRIKRILSRNYGGIFRNGNVGLFPDYYRPTPSPRAGAQIINKS